MTDPALEITPASLRRAFGAHPTGVVVVASVSDGEPVGMALSSFLSVSLDPPLVLVSIAHTSTTWPRLQRSPELGLSVLAEHQEPISRALSARGADRFAGIRWHTAGRGAVHIDDASLWIRCTVEGTYPGGDHDLVLLRIGAIAENPDSAWPLVFHGSSYRRLGMPQSTPEQR